MPMRQMLILLVQGMLTVFALGCCVALLFITSQQTNVAVAALAALGLGQILGAIANAIANHRIGDYMESCDQSVFEALERTRSFDHRLDQAIAKVSQTERRSLTQEQTFAEGLSGLRHSYAELAHHLSQTLSNDRVANSFPPTQFAEPLPAEPLRVEPSRAERPLPAPTPPPVETFVTALEPVIDVNTGATVHYRVQVSLIGDGSGDVPYQVLANNADQNGARPELDRYVVSEALLLIERLRQRNANLRIFMSLGVPTLLDENALRDILSMLNNMPQLANGLVMELSHANLGRLSEQGIAGLALLARSGVAMALTEVAISGLDLPSLRQLGVKFFGLAANGLVSSYGVSPAIIGFTQSARAMQFQMIVTDVTSPEVAAAIPQVARFACGPFFAAPRKVKSTADRQGESSQRFAA